jgi:hypothetical protein
MLCMNETNDHQPGAPPQLDLVSYAEIARRVVLAGFAPTMSRQRIVQLHQGTMSRGKRAYADPNFPSPVTTTGKMRLFNWHEVKQYFEQRDATIGRRKGWTTNSTEPSTH